MLSGKSEQLYVAELKVPSLFYSTSETRGEIPKPSEFGISKGYYVILPRDAHSVVSGHAEVVLVIEFLSPGLLEAEARAISMGEVFSSLLSAFGAYPASVFPTSANRLHGRKREPENRAQLRVSRQTLHAH